VRRVFASVRRAPLALLLGALAGVGSWVLLALAKLSGSASVAALAIVAPLVLCLAAAALAACRLRSLAFSLLVFAQVFLFGWLSWLAALLLMAALGHAR
jgi:hypothetical protein